MNKKTTDPAIARRRNIVRALLVLVYFGLIAVVFITGKGHSILVDNKDAGTLQAVDGVLISVDTQEELELYSGDRDKFDVKGQRHRVRAETIDGSVKVDKVFSVPVGGEMYILSIPKLLAGEDPYIEPFTVLEVATPQEDSGEREAFTSPETVGDALPESLETTGAEAPATP